MARVNLRDALDEGASQLTFSLDTGFVANERVSLQLGSDLTLTLEGLIVPGANLRLKTIYTLEARTERRLAGLLTLRRVGERWRLEWGLELGAILP